jgi:ferritin-like metal-binding protein YciE
MRKLIFVFKEGIKMRVVTRTSFGHHRKYTSMKFASLNDLYLQQLKDLHSAESQLIKALPKKAKAARNPDLKNAFIEHLEQTKGHLERLKQLAEKLGKRLAGHTLGGHEGSHR